MLRNFVDFKDIVPGPGKGDSVTLRDAAERFFARFPEGEKIDHGVWIRYRSGVRC